MSAPVGNTNSVGHKGMMKKTFMNALRQNELDDLKVDLYKMSKEFLYHDSEKVRFEAWKELLKYVYPVKREVASNISALPEGSSIEEFVLKARKINSPNPNPEPKPNLIEDTAGSD